LWTINFDYKRHNCILSISLKLGDLKKIENNGFSQLKILVIYLRMCDSCVVAKDFATTPVSRIEDCILHLETVLTHWQCVTRPICLPSLM